MVYLADLRQHMSTTFIHMEETVSQIFYLGFSFHKKTGNFQTFFFKWCDQTMKCGAINPVQTVHGAISPDNVNRHRHRHSLFHRCTPGCTLKVE